MRESRSWSPLNDEKDNRATQNPQITAEEIMEVFSLLLTTLKTASQKGLRIKGT